MRTSEQVFGELNSLAVEIDLANRYEIDVSDKEWEQLIRKRNELLAEYEKLQLKETAEAV